MNDTADKLELSGTSCWGGERKSRLQRAWESGVLVPQSRSPAAVGKLVPGAHQMSGPEAAGWRAVCLGPALTFPCLGTPFPFNIQAAEVASTTEGRELRKYCWWLGK